MNEAFRGVAIQYRDFDVGEDREMCLAEGERVIGVESATAFDRIFRVWIEVPIELARAREDEAFRNRESLLAQC